MDSIDGFKIPIRPRSESSLPMAWPIDRSTSRPVWKRPSVKHYAF